MSSSPVILRAEHSAYSVCSSLDIANPSSYVTGFSFLAAKRSRYCVSFRKSVLQPTRMIGTPGQYLRTSGTHTDLTSANEGGLTTEKQTRNTLVNGYDNGLSLSESSLPAFQ
eukprot:Phypoly_transcript_22738.p1 GENE.Phypoly_transcript_22738~~Phypoly_transcript_22738.p1  ORF type:complete len:112 (-),score=0.27 Phypoly_transcript_22738:125-460(-)